LEEGEVLKLEDSVRGGAMYRAELCVVDTVRVLCAEEETQAEGEWEGEGWEDTDRVAVEF
jgi:hypothetical protein